jgi:steroid delta-isomerase-like uncharacterized protein
VHALRLSRRATVRLAGAGALTGFFGSRFASALAQDASPVASPTDCMVTSAEDNLALALRWFTDVLNQANPDAIDELVTPDIVFDPSNFPTSTGTAGIKDVLTTLFTAFPDVHYTTAETLSDDDMVVIRWSATGTQTSAFLGIAPTNESHRWSGIHFFRISCGKISDVWAEADILSQVGLSAPDGTPIPEDASATPGLLAGACQDSTPDEMTAIAQRWMDVWNTHDVTGYEDFVHPNAIHHFGVRPDAIGLPAIEAGLTAFFEGFPGLQATIATIVVDGNLVAIRYTDTGIQEGEFLGAAPDGKTVTWTGMTVLRVSCGQVIESWGEADGFGIWQQLGLLDRQATPVA